MTDTLTVKDLIAELRRYHPDDLTDVAAITRKVIVGSRAVVRLISDDEERAAHFKNEAARLRREAESTERQWRTMQGNAERARRILAHLRNRSRPLPLP